MQVRRRRNTSAAAKETHANLGRMLRSCRRRKGMSQGDLAKAVGMSQTSVSDLESGRVLRDHWNVCRLVAAAVGAPLRLIPSRDDVDVCWNCEAYVWDDSDCAMDTVTAIALLNEYMFGDGAEPGQFSFFAGARSLSLIARAMAVKARVEQPDVARPWEFHDYFDLGNYDAYSYGETADQLSRCWNALHECQEWANRWASGVRSYIRPEPDKYEKHLDEGRSRYIAFWRDRPGEGNEVVVIKREGSTRD